MGTFFHPITIISAKGRATIDVLVDIDEMFALLPYDLLERLDFWPNRSRRYRGHWRGFGQVEGEILGQRGWITYMVAAEGEQPRIGRHTLDSFVLDVEEENERLVAKELWEIRHV